MIHIFSLTVVKHNVTETPPMVKQKLIPMLIHKFMNSYEGNEGKQLHALVA
jgi:hypothetical protein